MQIGYKLAAEGFGPKELIRQAVLAEQPAHFVEMSTITIRGWRLRDTAPSPGTCCPPSP